MYIIPFTSSDAGASPDSPLLETAGGKGANLIRLTRAGFDVPRGFILSTSAYREFVRVNKLDVIIQQALKGLKPEDTDVLEHASQTIRQAFAEGVLPTGIHSEIQSAYAELNQGPVAVRSSATAEDLPDLSFAGQQDTYLNIIGEDQLIQAVVNCWSSLWTARAIGYRIRNHISHDEASLAVVVQEMVEGSSGTTRGPAEARPPSDRR